MRNKVNYSMYINTGQEFNWSDSGMSDCHHCWSLQVTHMCSSAGRGLLLRPSVLPAPPRMPTMYQINFKWPYRHVWPSLDQMDQMELESQVKQNSHLKISQFTQHFEKKLDLTMTPLDFFKEKLMPKDPIQRIHALMARYGFTGDMQSQIMGELSAGQKACIIFTIISWEYPHLLIFDEPANPLDMESLDTLARCLTKFQGGVLMISHNMHLISQCAQEIYICDKKKMSKYQGDIMDFKMHTKKENNKKLAQHQNG
eukprot:scaffold68763_cov59-Attheya_sp.AAC.6